MGAGRSVGIASREVGHFGGQGCFFSVTSSASGGDRGCDGS